MRRRTTHKEMKKKNVRKKWYYACLLGTMLMAFMLSYAYAQSIQVNINSSKWHSDSYNVGYWEKTPYVSFSNLSSSFSIVSYVNNAVNKWNKAGIECAITTVPSNAKIRFYGGTKSQLIALGFAYSSNINGLTMFDSYSTAAEDYPYKVNKLSAVSVSMCSDLTYNGLSASQINTTILNTLYNHVALHEMGHAMGWYGHSFGINHPENTVMYKYTCKIFTLTAYDTEHLTTIYKLMKGE